MNTNNNTKINQNINMEANLLAELESERNFFQAFQTLTSDLIFRYYIQDDIMKYYGPLREILGIELSYENYSVEILKDGILFSDDAEIFTETLDKMRRGENGSGCYRVYDQDGNPIWLKKEWLVYFDETNQPLEVIGRVTNVQVQMELEERVNIDELTGCLQKVAFETLVESTLKNLPDDQHTVIIVDLDNFKAINDNLGHQFGDMVLAEVGQKLRSLFRASDYVGRIGGDEFMVFMRKASDVDLITEKANAVLKEMNLKYKGTLHEYHISASIGIATYPQDSINFQDLYECADIAMFDAKNRGKNDFVFYDKKLSKGTMENTMPYDIASRALSQHFDQKTVSQAFNLLFETKDFEFSMNEVLHLLGTRFAISRAYIFETNKHNENVYDNTYEWCAKGIESAQEFCQGIPKETFQQLMKLGNEDGIIYCNDVDALEDEVKEILDVQGIKSFLHAYIYSGDEVLYAIGFDDCVQQRVWSPIEISSLLHVSKIIAQFLNYKHALKNVQEISEERLSVMNALDYYAYIVDKDTYEITYFNTYTRCNLPNIKTGDICYKVLRGFNDVCSDCPMREMEKQQKDKVRMIINNTNINQQMLINASYLASYKGKESVFVTGNEVTDLLACK